MSSINCQRINNQQPCGENTIGTHDTKTENNKYPSPHLENSCSVNFKEQVQLHPTLDMWCWRIYLSVLLLRCGVSRVRSGPGVTREELSIVVTVSLDTLTTLSW